MIGQFELVRNVTGQRVLNSWSACLSLSLYLVVGKVVFVKMRVRYMDSFVFLYDIRLIIKLESHCVLDHIKYVINPFNVGRG